MCRKNTVCLLNDSFPPQIDGVANTVVNYANNLPEYGWDSVVITPDHPKAADQAFSFPVIRYPSISFPGAEGYMAGIPFSPETARLLERTQVGLIHTHCPIMSTFMAREIRHMKNAPVVLTYHTKFDVDIANITSNRQLQNACKKALVANISACDEVWTVSTGAGENLASLGYEGAYVVMPNGVDFPQGRVQQAQIEAATAGYDLPQGVRVYLFVGRLMWYKGIRIILDALSALAAQGEDFRMVFIGNGDDRQQIEAYALQHGLAAKCIFTGPIHDRQLLRAWYCRADLFLFPSTFDTNGLVVREAAACSLASVLIKGSCAAEGVTHMQNGFLIEESAESLCRLLSGLKLQTVQAVGICAGKELYLSWSDAVGRASERYGVVMEQYAAGKRREHLRPMEGFLKMNGELMELLGKLSQLRHREK